MKNLLIKRIIVTIIIFSFIFPVLLLPKKTKAVFGVGDITYDPTNYVQNVINVGNTTVSATSNYSVQLKEYILDPLASGLAKQVIRTMTGSIVNWINSGFEGSPSFVQNPGAFFLDVADQITGDFLSKFSGPLTALCSPFSIDIRLALAFKYHPNIQKRYACTLGTIIQNSKGAIKNASINGFTAGDFRQGGWPAFVSLTTEPQNNIYGAYLQAESELSFRIASAQDQKNKELGAGKGFLSWKDPKCLKEVRSNEQQARNNSSVYDPVTDTYVYDPNSGTSGTSEIKTIKTEQDCPILTPGSVIASSLETQLGSPVRQLELADEIGEIVNALFAQLVTQVLSVGLGTVSGSSPSDSGSYINQIQTEAYQSSSQELNDAKAKLIKEVDTVLTPTNRYQANKNASLNIFIDVKNNYEDIKDCYAQKITTSSSTARLYESKIAEIDAFINSQITPIATRLLEGSQEADDRMQTLLNIKVAANAAKTLNEINGPSQQFANIVSNSRLTNERDIQNSVQEYDDTQTLANQFNRDAQRKLQECQVIH